MKKPLLFITALTLSFIILGSCKQEDLSHGETTDSTGAVTSSTGTGTADASETAFETASEATARATGSDCAAVTATTATATATAAAAAATTTLPSSSTMGQLPKSSLPMLEEPLEGDLFSVPREYSVTHIMIHFMSNVTVTPKDPFNMAALRNQLITGEVSVHYIIDRDGVIHRLIPEERKAHHAGPGQWDGNPEYTNNMNRYSVGIELCGIGTREEMSRYIPSAVYDALDPSFLGFTNAQYDTLALLIADIRTRHPAVSFDRRHIIGHDEYSATKVDPGKLFDWTRIGLPMK